MYYAREYEYYEYKCTYNCSCSTLLRYGIGIGNRAERSVVIFLDPINHKSELDVPQSPTLSL
jgi:hypothetical protein